MLIRIENTEGLKKFWHLRAPFMGECLYRFPLPGTKKKREPFQIPGIESEFVAPVVIPDQRAYGLEIPKGWQAAWECGPSNQLEEKLKKIPVVDEFIELEIKALLKTKEKLQTKEIYAIILEPRQCEGGERYLSTRFHHGLVNLARSFSVAVIYDEVQCGFGLSGEFFWHRLFKLIDGKGKPIFPDYVTAAKKAQTGMVLSKKEIELEADFSTASVHRGYIQGLCMDQYEARTKQIEGIVAKELDSLVKKYSTNLSGARNKGLSFAFDFNDEKLLKEFITTRFQYGLLFYQAGANTARFRLNHSFRPELIKFLFETIDLAISNLSQGKPAPKEARSYTTKRISPEAQYSFHRRLAKLKRKILLNEEHSTKEITEVLDEILEFYLGDDAKNTKVVFIDSSNYSKYRDKIIQFELEVYEPSRRTPIEDFDVAIEAPRGVALAVEFKGEVVGMAVGAPLKRYPTHRGVRRDIHFDNLNAVYMLAVTVGPEFQGMSLGRILKYGFSLFALRNGVEFIAGRNRDKIARGMLGINLALGAYEQIHLYEDYQDDEEYRDVIYYTIPLKWEEPKINLSSAISSPLGSADLTDSFIENNYPALVNKTTLGNFTSERFLDLLEDFGQLLPEPLRHLYTTSGQSECVEKIIKTLWRKQSAGESAPRKKLVTFEGMYFGSGSFSSRALSGVENPYFDVARLPLETEWVENLENTLADNSTLAVFVEPLMQKTGERVSEEDLKLIREICTRYKTPLVFNDTGSLFSRYSEDFFLASSIKEIEPDLGISYLGGQMGVCYSKEEFYSSDPLLLISTWEGDEFAFASFMKAVESFTEVKQEKLRARKEFSKQLEQILLSSGISEYELINGVGWFKGEVPKAIADCFKKIGERSLVLATDSEIKKFIDEN